MTREEFATVMVFLERGIGKKLDPASGEVYYSLLGDLPVEILMAAAQRVLLENEYPVFPPVGKLRRLAMEAMQPARITGQEAWCMVRKAVLRFGYYRQEAGMNSLPVDVRRAAECLGWSEICDSTEPEIVRAQFVKAYEAIQTRVNKENLLPHALREQISFLSNKYGADNERNAAVRSGREILGLT